MAEYQGKLMTAWPLCSTHGRLKFRQNGQHSYYECMGYDGEGCPVMMTLAAFEHWWVSRLELPRGIDVAWTDGGKTTIELGGVL